MSEMREVRHVSGDKEAQPEGAGRSGYGDEEERMYQRGMG